MGAMALAVTLAAVLGLSTRRVELNLGPGDSPFVRGFEANSDVEDKVGWHWTTYDAQVHLPFVVRRADVDATLRYARMFGEEAVVAVSVGSVRTPEFRARGGEIRSTTLTAQGVSGPLLVGIRTDSHERRNMGIRMDRLRIDVRSGPPLRLTLEAAARPIVVAVLLFAGLLLLGASPMAAGGFTLLAAVGFAARASVDLFAAWRQTQSAPAMLVLSVVTLRLARHLMERHGGLARSTSTWLVSGALVTMLFRLVLVSHPDFYYPDLLTHTRVVEAIRVQGPAFFLNPAESLAEQKAWTKPVLGSVSALPYAVVFHTPFAILAGAFDLSIDAIETALKAASSLISVLPILIAGVLAVRFGLPPMAALALAVIPTYTSRLSFALLPALTGHVFDLIVLAMLAAAMPQNRSPSNRGALALFVALLAGHLAYTSSVVNEGLLMAVLVILVLATGKPGLPAAGRLVLAEAGAALLALALYYRHFVGDVVDLGSRLIGIAPPSSGAGPASSQYPIESFWGLLIERTDTFFGWPWLGLFVAGVLFAGAAFRGSVVPRAWVVAFLGLILLRAKIPDVFRYGHETLFLTPLVALLAGSALILAWERGGVARWASVAAGIALWVQSFGRQWASIADQLGNAL
jgi:hypothetical protein